MTGPVRAISGAALIVGGVLILGALSRVPFSAQPTPDGVIRLAWRTRSENVRNCRHRTADELARLPIHMREDEVCEGRLLPYRLMVALDEQPAADGMVRGAGARQDRPLY